MADDNKTILLKIDLDNQAMIKKVSDLKQQIDSLKKSNQDLQKAADAAFKAGDNATFQKITQDIVKNQVAIKNLSDESRNNINILNLQAKANNANAGSYEQLLRQQQIAQINLKNLAGTLKKNADGTLELTNEYKAQSKEVLKAKDAVLAFDAGIKDGRTNVGNYTSSFVAAIGQTGIFGDKLNVLKDTLNGAKAGVDALRAGIDSIREGASAAKGLATGIGGVAPAAEGGASAMKLLKVAIASTGIGILLVAVGSLIAYFTETEEGGNKIKVVFAALGQVVSALVGSLAKVGGFMVEAFSKPKQTLEDIGNIIKDNIINRFTAFSVILNAIKNFDGKALIDGLGQAATGIEHLTDKAVAAANGFGKFAKSQIDLAKIAADNARAQIDYEKGLIKTNEAQAANNLLIGDLRTLSENKTKTDQQRISALKEAGALEKANIDIDVANAKIRVTLAQNELKLAEANGTATIETRKKASEAVIEYNRLVDNSNDKAAETEAESSKVALQLQRATATAKIGILQDELKEKELNGQKDFDLQKQIELKKLNALIIDTTLSNIEREKLRKDYNLAIAEIDKAAADQEKAINQSIEDNAIAAIEDKTTRELAAEVLATQRKIDLLIGTDAQIQAQKESLLDASNTRLLEIGMAADEAELSRLQKVNQQKIDEAQKTTDALNAIEQSRLDLAGTVVSGFKTLLEQDKNARKKYGEALKVLALAEIAINLQKQISSIRANAAANPLNAIPGGVAIVATQTAIQTAIAIVQAAVAGGNVLAQKFAKGGSTTPDWGQSFAKGGNVTRPRLGLIGEAGPEWVAPNWMLNSRQLAPVFSNLEYMRRTGTLAFADGGFTQSTAFNPTNDIINAFKSIKLSVAVQDINEAQGVLAMVEDRSTY